MKLYPDIIQGSPEWYAVRLGKVTASNLAKVLAKGKGSKGDIVLPSKGRKDLMIRLVAERMTGLPSESYSNGAMEWGSQTECEAREYYEALNGVSVRQVGFIERDDDVGCSPDGLVGDGGMTQFKCPNSSTHIATILAGKMPTKHTPQVQTELWVAERKWCDFVSYDPRVSKRPYFCKRVYRDDDYIKQLGEKIDLFVDQMKDMLKQLQHCPY